MRGACDASRMRITRRGFLRGASAGLAATLVVPRLASARGLLTDPVLDDLIGKTLAAAKRAGATYADVRIVRMRNESITTRDDHVESVTSTDDYGVGVRVLAGGAWG